MIMGVYGGKGFMARRRQGVNALSEHGEHLEGFVQ